MVIVNAIASPAPPVFNVYVGGMTEPLPGDLSFGQAVAVPSHVDRTRVDLRTAGAAASATPLRTLEEDTPEGAVLFVVLHRRDDEPGSIGVALAFEESGHGAETATATWLNAGWNVGFLDMCAGENSAFITPGLADVINREGERPLWLWFDVEPGAPLLAEVHKPSRRPTRSRPARCSGEIFGSTTITPVAGDRIAFIAAGTPSNGPAPVLLACSFPVGARDARCVSGTSP